MAEAPVLVAEGLRKAFASGTRRVTALDGIDLQVRAGTVTGLIGPDGAGKTTFMRLAAGLLGPDEGRVSVLGRDATGEAAAVQRALGYMPQRFGLYEDLSVQENLDLYADLQGVPRAERAARYDELMRMTGLAPFTRRLAGRLSGGMKQKLGLACTLVRPPRLLLLDEPTVGVDPVSRRELWAIVDRLVKGEGMSVLLATAYLDEAERCADVILLHEGRMLDQGAPAELSARLAGRTWRVTRAETRPRDLIVQIEAMPGIVDALVQGEHVRVVTAGDALPEAVTTVAGTEVEAVPPRFEDAFIDRLHAQQPRAGATAAMADAPVAQVDPTDVPVIRAVGAKRRFGDFWAVDGVDFEIRQGEIFGLLGANGAGKTTTFRMLCGLLPASAGQLEVAGLDLRRAASVARARIGYMSQKFSLYGNLTVRQNLDFFARAYGLAGDTLAARIAWAVDEFDLGAAAEQLSGELPLGYKQRLAMACALMHRPRILFLDEPTSGVDPMARREFWRRINALAREGVTVLVTTHFMEEAEYCDRLAIMAAGRILAQDAPAAIKAQARRPGRPEPSLEDAFIGLIEAAEAQATEAAA
ncbi:ABC transporter ATP-binding protein [Nitrogeniibacter mangrovi]|uniref:ABC transporter ATP-binding protein n=1 Tax=Nitrogeniibacter mangrovi TaxID=2016596 RepID=A0A6C1AZ19_9RHOO|nr:ATP-binding cassette domain-containing protein [Nitrogeniibacter mangrovi]QID16587.1 ABC transporter ATP-binding protein [Nitrogeniibacter mangrovi]